MTVLMCADLIPPRIDPRRLRWEPPDPVTAVLFPALQYPETTFHWFPAAAGRAHRVAIPPVKGGAERLLWQAVAGYWFRRGGPTKRSAASSIRGWPARAVRRNPRSTDGPSQTECDAAGARDMDPGEASPRRGSLPERPAATRRSHR